MSSLRDRLNLVECKRVVGERSRVMSLVVGVSCSPRRESNTEVLVERVLEGARDAGAETRLFAFSRMTVAPCKACQACKEAPADRCVIEDDMRPVYEALDNAQGLVLATPIYLDYVTAQAKTFIDRLYCYIRPPLERWFPKDVKFALIFTQGHPRAGAYTEMIASVQRILRNYFDLKTFETIVAEGCDGVEALRGRTGLLRRAYQVGRALQTR